MTATLFSLCPRPPVNSDMHQYGCMVVIWYPSNAPSVQVKDAEKKAMAAFGAGDFEGASSLFIKALKLAPDKCDGRPLLDGTVVRAA